MEPLEIGAKTVEEAVEQALERLGLSRDEVEIEVIQRGRSGFLGLGAEEARVKVSPIHPQSAEADPSELAKGVLEKLLDLMGMVASVETKVPALDGAGSWPSSIALDVKGEDLGILIGRRGQTLASLQHIVRLIVSHRFKGSVPLSVDVEGYTERHDYSLKSLALRLAGRASSSGRAVTLEPMPASERRVIHLALADHPDVTTSSVAYEEARKVVILPRAQQPSPG